MKYLEILKTVMGVVSKAEHIQYIDCPSFKEWKKSLCKYSITKEVVDLLDGVPQGTKWHPEFDALKHVYYVCKASICDTDTTLLEAAFLHDVGKSTHTNIGRDLIYSFGHADASAWFVENHKDNITDFELTYRIVKQHMDFNNFESSKLQYDIPLKFFLWADKTESRKLYLSESSKIECLINKCKEKRLYLKQRFSKQKVIILIGQSGVGKSTYIKNNFDPKYVVCPDEIRRQMSDINDMSTNHEVWKLTKSLMQGKLNTYSKVVLDATNVNKWLRIMFMGNFNGCRKEAIFFDIEPEICIKRVKDDIKNGIKRSNVPESVIRKQYKLLNKGTRSMYNEFNTVTVISRSLGEDDPRRG